MKEIKLKYGCNPNQIPARLFMKTGNNLPIEILNGSPGYINFLDALHSWQLVCELKTATNQPAAASFKHVSPSGAAIATKLNPTLEKTLLVEDLNLTSKIAIAYAKARGANRLCSYGDWVALSDECDQQTAIMLKREVSDGIIAPSFSKDALQILKTKKNGNYCIIKIDESYKPNEIEYRELFGIVFEQKRNDIKIDDETFSNVVTKNKNITKSELNDLKIATIILKYTQSNSICLAINGMAVGIGAGQQSRIDCTKIAGYKSNCFFLKQHPKILNLPFIENIPRPFKDNIINEFITSDFPKCLENGTWNKFFYEKPSPLANIEKQQWLNKQSKSICLASDGFFPFSDNIEQAVKFNVGFISQPGGSIRDNEIIEKCDELNLLMSLTNIRLFLH